MREAWADNPMPGIASRGYFVSGRVENFETRVQDADFGEGWLSEADEEKLFKAEGWWGRAHRMFRLNGGKLDDLKTAKLNDVSAWSIISALIMTIGLGALTVGTTNNYPQDDAISNNATAVFVVFAMISSFSALTSIVMASVDYVYFNATPPEFFPKALLKRYSEGGCHFWPWMILSWVFLFVSSCSLIYVLLWILSIHVRHYCSWDCLPYSHIVSISNGGIAHRLHGCGSKK